MNLRVDWLDVCTDTAFAGNPLAVVPDADELDERQMQTIAAELGLSETVFVIGGAERLRIFTPTAELPLAGHPVIGVTHDLVRLGRIPGDSRHVFQTQAGETPVEIGGGIATMTQGEFDPGSELDPDALAPLLGLSPADVVGAPRVCSTTGVRHAFVRVGDREALRAIRADLAAIAAFDVADGVAPWCEEGEAVLAQRFFAPRIGVPEDPATGSAAGALGALRVFEGAEPGALTVSQGEELGRPSILRVTVGGAPGAPANVRVGGGAVLILEGRLSV